MKYAQVALGLPIDKLFDYLIPEPYGDDCSLGCRVLVPFLRHHLVGYVVAVSSRTKVSKVKPITKLIDQKPILNDKMLELTKLVSDYYFSSWGQAIEAALPADIRRGLAVSISETGLLPLDIIEHEDAYGYKDERSPYYHARNVALMRAQFDEDI